VEHYALLLIAATMMLSSAAIAARITFSLKLFI
jgi:hypothetical protein